MSRSDTGAHAALAAEIVLKDHGIVALPIDPIALARDLGIEVFAKDASAEGVSGMFLRIGNAFGIAYATHIGSVGFQNFSVAHELGHYFLPGHADAVLAHGDVHESRAGFTSDERFEVEADHFAASLIMPRLLFMDAMRTAGEGLVAIESLAQLCRTSLTATGIRFVQCSRDPVAVVLSTGDKINFCFMSDALKEVKGLSWIRKGEGLSKGTATYAFNRDADRVRRVDRIEATSDLQDWFASDLSIEITEQVIGLGSYGKTLTVLTAPHLEDEMEEIDEEEEFVESWRPRFGR